MIAPIANVRPRVVRLNSFPIKTVFGNAVRVITVKGGCIQELVYHALDELGVGMRQCLPVLKNIAPVSLVIEDFRTVLFISRVDGKLVPRTAWITMTTAKLQWEVFRTKASESCISRVCSQST